MFSLGMFVIVLRGWRMESKASGLTADLLNIWVLVLTDKQVCAQSNDLFRPLTWRETLDVFQFTVESILVCVQFQLIENSIQGGFSGILFKLILFTNPCATKAERFVMDLDCCRTNYVRGAVYEAKPSDNRQCRARVNAIISSFLIVTD